MPPNPGLITQIRVVVVESDLLTRIKLKTNILCSRDIVVIGETCSGEDAVKMAERLRPDVVIMDVGVPAETGEIVRKILASHGNIGIIMMTRRMDEHDIFVSLAAGATGYCMKDAGPEHLHTAIRSVYAGDTWIDAENACKMLTKHYSDRTGAIVLPIERPLGTFFTTRTDHASLDAMKNSDACAIEPEPLSARELEVVHLIVEGLSNRDIADTLIVSLATAKSHVRNVLNKFAVRNRTQAAICAMKHGIV